MNSQEGKKMVCGKDEVVVKKAWFKTLLKILKEYEDAKVGEYKLNHLLVYCHTAEMILETDFKETHK